MCLITITLRIFNIQYAMRAISPHCPGKNGYIKCWPISLQYAITKIHLCSHCMLLHSIQPSLIMQMLCYWISLLCHMPQASSWPMNRRLQSYNIRFTSGIIATPFAVIDVINFIILYCAAAAAGRPTTAAAAMHIVGPAKKRSTIIFSDSTEMCASRRKEAFKIFLADDWKDSRWRHIRSGRISRLILESRNPLNLTCISNVSIYAFT